MVSALLEPVAPVVAAAALGDAASFAADQEMHPWRPPGQPGGDPRGGPMTGNRPVPCGWQKPTQECPKITASDTQLTARGS